MRKQQKFRLVGRRTQMQSNHLSRENTVLQCLTNQYPTDDPMTMAWHAMEQRVDALLEDRHRIGRELHDCVLQSLYAIGLGLQTGPHTPGAPGLAAGVSDNAVHLINKLIHEIRMMIRDLEQGKVQEFDLRTELRDLATTYEEASRIRIELFVQDAALRALTHEEERELLNIAREALDNCMRHAQATTATITLIKIKSIVRMAIADNGLGFLSRDSRAAGYGLTNMEARAKRLGGQLLVRSRPGRGTTIMAQFALEPALVS